MNRPIWKSSQTRNKTGDLWISPVQYKVGSSLNQEPGKYRGGRFG